MDENNETGLSEPRPEAEVYKDLRALAQSDSALHEISSLIYRDIFVTVDQDDGRITDDPEYRWSTSKLNRNEILLLLGLMVQSQTERTYTVKSGREDFSASADTLFRDFHDRVFFNFVSSFDIHTPRFTEQEDSIGHFGQEAIYYGPDSFYTHQFLNFSCERYRKDAEWLKENVGISINTILDIANFIFGCINTQITIVGHLREAGHKLNNSDLTESLLIPKQVIRKKYGAKSDAFIAKFVTPMMATNKGFTNPFAINTFALAPLIEIGEFLYVNRPGNSGDSVV